MQEADVVLYVTDVTDPAPIPAISENMIIIRNKIDLINAPPAIESINGNTHIAISAQTGTGLDLLKLHIKSHVGFNESEGIYLARRRHLDALKRAKEYLEASFRQLTEMHSIELAAEDLRLAQRALSEITGEFSTDDLLGNIFSSFCVGK